MSSVIPQWHWFAINFFCVLALLILFPKIPEKRRTLFTYLFALGLSLGPCLCHYW